MYLEFSETHSANLCPKHSQLKLDGELDETKPGMVRMSSLNASFPIVPVSFTEQFKYSIYSLWISNISFEVNGMKVHGYGNFNDGTEISSLAWYDNMSRVMCFWSNRPPPPGPAPSPPEVDCVERYNQSGCEARKDCLWCSSTDGAHHLCFTSTARPAKEDQKWKCTVNVSMKHIDPDDSNTCKDESASGQSPDTKLASEAVEAADYGECCVLCYRENLTCRSWSFNPDVDAKKPCHFYNKNRLIFHAPKSSHVGIGTFKPHPPHPTPKPSPPTPRPTPPPAPPPTPPTPSPPGMKNWAVIVSGSKGFGNYRHHADACHAFKVMVRNGIPRERIILMMQDNVANDKGNPFPGKLFNKPTAEGTAGVDVYEGCFPDYTGNGVTAQLFLNVLRGEETHNATKVLKSQSIDKVFVYFVDHGGPGLISMPNGPALHAADLIDALKEMHSKKMYDKLVFYMEACESGSMFEKILPNNLSIYATTAANAKESSWGTYCSPNDKINGVHVRSCLGDLYSVSWLEDSDHNASLIERLGDQFNRVQAETNRSHVMDFGTMSFKWTDHVGDYQAAPNVHTAIDDSHFEVQARDAVDSRDIALHLSRFNLAQEVPGTVEWMHAADELGRVLNERQTTDAIFAHIFAAMPRTAATSEIPLANSCQRQVLDAFQDQCEPFNSYSLKYARPLIDLCTAHSASEIKIQIRIACGAHLDELFV